MQSTPRQPLDKPRAANSLLVVSPVQEDRTLLRQMLPQSDWEVCEACDCAEGVLRLHGKAFAVVICECSLPDGDWKTLFEEASRRPNPPMVIVSSRLADSRLWAEALNLGAHDVLATPFDPNEVLRVVTYALRSWEKPWWSLNGVGGNWASSVSQGLGD